jgi:hypothetical protein
MLRPTVHQQDPKILRNLYLRNKESNYYHIIWTQTYEQYKKVTLASKYCIPVHTIPKDDRTSRWTLLPGGHKEMSSILAEQERPRRWVQLRGEVAGSQPMCTNAQCTWSQNKLWRSNYIFNLSLLRNSIVCHKYKYVNKVHTRMVSQTVYNIDIFLYIFCLVVYQQQWMSPPESLPKFSRGHFILPTQSWTRIKKRGKILKKALKRKNWKFAIYENIVFIQIKDSERKFKQQNLCSFFTI